MHYWSELWQLCFESDRLGRAQTGYVAHGEMPETGSGTLRVNPAKPVGASNCMVERFLVLGKLLGRARLLQQERIRVEK